MAGAILIVEDHDPVRSSLKKWLAIEFPQYRIVEASSGEEAVDFAKGNSLDLVLMDIGLPVMNGIEATRHIKSHGQDVKIVMLTIYEDEAHRNEARVAGASAYIPKRVMQNELLPVIRTLLPSNGDNNK